AWGRFPPRCSRRSDGADTPSGRRPLRTSGERVGRRECRKEPGRLGGIDGPAPEVTPSVLAPELDQLSPVVPGFDPFGDHLQPATVSEADDRLDDRRVLTNLAKSGDEAAVDLQRLDGDAAQMRHRRVPGAEVVHRQLDTHPAEFGDDVR